MAAVGMCSSSHEKLHQAAMPSIKLQELMLVEPLQPCEKGQCVAVEHCFSRCPRAPQYRSARIIILQVIQSLPLSWLSDQKVERVQSVGRD